jgi:hypothetical protein
VRTARLDEKRESKSSGGGVPEEAKGRITHRGRRVGDRHAVRGEI